MGEGCCHNHENCHDYSKINKKRIGIAFLIVLLVMVAEFVGGIISGSIALVSDAAHMSVDAMALGIAYWASGKRIAENYAALINGIILIGMAIWIFIAATLKFINPGLIICEIMIGVAVVGLIANLVQIFILHGGDRRNINMRGAYLHVLSDTLCSVAVIVGGIVVYFTKISRIDSVLGYFIGVIVLIGAVRLLRDSFKQISKNRKGG